MERLGRCMRRGLEGHNIRLDYIRSDETACVAGFDTTCLVYGDGKKFEIENVLQVMAVPGAGERQRPREESPNPTKA